jgi:alkylhydroperoxidase family enzyme
MAWIRTIPSSQADEGLRGVLSRVRAMYPPEYSGNDDSGVMSSHTLIPDALYHAFATLAALMAPALPLSRSQQEMIATVVSVTNSCAY